MKPARRVNLKSRLRETEPLSSSSITNLTSAFFLSKIRNFECSYIPNLLLHHDIPIYLPTRPRNLLINPLSTFKQHTLLPPNP